MLGLQIGETVQMFADELQHHFAAVQKLAKDTAENLCRAKFEVDAYDVTYVEILGDQVCPVNDCILFMLQVSKEKEAIVNMRIAYERKHHLRWSNERCNTIFSRRG